MYCLQYTERNSRDMGKIRVLVIDDSIVFRELLSRGISLDKDIEVVATAKDPFEARDKIIKHEPDVVTCDINMQKMNGIEFVRRLMPQYPLPVIVVSEVSDAVFSAMNAGAVDFVAKPDVRSAGNMETFINEMIIKIKTASVANVSGRKMAMYPHGAAEVTKIETDKRIIAIGASTGGTEAIFRILSSLSPSVPGIVIVQHIPPGFSKMFADRLDYSTEFEVKEAKTGDFVENGKVLLAPGDYHMKIRKAGERYKVECFRGEKVNGHCPSVDVLFESVAREAGNHAVGVILTGMGYDGAKGLLTMRRKGARTIGQDERSSVVYGMPKVAYDVGAVERQASLDDIPKLICSMLTGR